MRVHKLFFVSLLFAAVLSAPLAAGAVMLEATRTDRIAAYHALSPAMWSARSFVKYFDLLVPVALVPCAVWIWRLRARGVSR